jgi:hypothetical protein
MNSRNKNIRNQYREIWINEFKRAYQVRNNLAKDENGDLLADILDMWKELLLSVIEWAYRQWC